MKLSEFLEEFRGAEPEDALEILMELGDRLPEPSGSRTGESRPADCRIRECQTPVFLWIDVENGKLRLEAEVPEQSPTVRGFVALLVLGLEGATVEEAARLPDDFLPLLGLEAALGMTRRHGFRGIVARIKQEASRVAEAGGA